MLIDGSQTPSDASIDASAVNTSIDASLTGRHKSLLGNVGTGAAKCNNHSPKRPRKASEGAATSQQRQESRRARLGSLKDVAACVVTGYPSRTRSLFCELAKPFRDHGNHLASSQNQSAPCGISNPFPSFLFNQLLIIVALTRIVRISLHLFQSPGALRDRRGGRVRGGGGSGGGSRGDSHFGTEVDE